PRGGPLLRILVQRRRGVPLGADVGPSTRHGGGAPRERRSREPDHGPLQLLRRGNRGARGRERAHRDRPEPPRQGFPRDAGRRRGPPPRGVPPSAARSRRRRPGGRGRAPREPEPAALPPPPPR